LIETKIKRSEGVTLASKDPEAEEHGVEADPLGAGELARAVDPRVRSPGTGIVTEVHM